MVFEADQANAYVVGARHNDPLSSAVRARAMLEGSTDLNREEMDRLFKTGKFVDEKNGAWIVVE